MRRVRVRPRHSRAFKLLLPAALALLALALTPSSFGIVNLDDQNDDQISDFDARGAAAPTADQVAAASSVHGKVSVDQVRHAGAGLPSRRLSRHRAEGAERRCRRAQLAGRAQAARSA